MSGWEPIECAWLVDMFADAARPWSQGTIRAYLRYADKCVRRGVVYWTPEDAPPQIVAEAGRRAAKGADLPIGRRALAFVSGVSGRQARNLLSDPEGWRDAYPGPSRVRPESVPGVPGKTPVEPASASRVCPGSVPGLSRTRAVPYTDHSTPITNTPQTPTPADAAAGPPESETDGPRPVGSNPTPGADDEQQNPYLGSGGCDDRRSGCRVPQEARKPAEGHRRAAGAGGAVPGDCSTAPKRGVAGGDQRRDGRPAEVDPAILGKGLKPDKVDPGALAVFNDWRRRQKSPKATRLTKARHRLLKAACADYDVSEVLAVVQLAYDAPIAPRGRGLPESYKRPWRDDGPAALEMLMRRGNLARNVEMALEWKAGPPTKGPDAAPESPEVAQRVWSQLTMNAGNLGALRARYGDDRWLRVCKTLQAAGIGQRQLAEIDYGNQRRAAFVAAWSST